MESRLGFGQMEVPFPAKGGGKKQKTSPFTRIAQTSRVILQSKTSKQSSVVVLMK